MKTHSTRIKEEHIIKYLDKNLKDCPEKRFVINKIKESMEDYPFDRDYEEWVDLHDDSYYICDKCKKPVKRYWHKHTAVAQLRREHLYTHWDNNSDLCLCEWCFKEMVGDMNI